MSDLASLEESALDSLAKEASYPDPWVDPNSRSTSGDCNLHRRGIEIENWGFYFMDPSRAWLGVLYLGVLLRRPLLFGVYVNASDVWKLLSGHSIRLQAHRCVAGHDAVSPPILGEVWHLGEKANSVGRDPKDRIKHKDPNMAYSMWYIYIYIVWYRVYGIWYVLVHGI